MTAPAIHLMRNISRVRPLALVSAAAAVAVAALATPTLAAPVPEASSKLLFASFGDMPYLVPAVNYRQNGQEAEDRLVLQRLIEPTLRRRRDIPFLIHMGDIGRVEDACRRPWQEATLTEWNRIGKPLVVLPGDNDWVDCGRLGVQPLDRLKEIRETFYSDKQDTTTNVLTGDRGLCTSRIPGLTCEAKPPKSTPEMVRWSYRNVAFAAIHYTSSNNGWVENDASRQRDTAERVQAMKEVLGELRQTAIQRKREAVVVATQVDPFTEKCQGHYAEICESVRQLARKLPVPVLLVHGDTNAYCLDQPIADAPNLWRLNGVGDWKVIDADLVSFDPSNPRKPFTVRGLLTGLEPLSRCNYRSQEPDDNLRYNRLAALVPLAEADCDHRTVTNQITPATEDNLGGYVSLTQTGERLATVRVALTQARPHTVYKLKLSCGAGLGTILTNGEGIGNGTFLLDTHRQRQPWAFALSPEAAPDADTYRSEPIRFDPIEFPVTMIKVAVAMADQGQQQQGPPSGDLELTLRKGNAIHYRTLLRKDPSSNSAKAEWTLKGLNLNPDSLATLQLRSSSPLPLKEITLKFNNRFLVLKQVGTPALAPRRSSGTWLWEASLSPMGLGKVAKLGWVGANELRWSPVEGAADYAVRVTDARGQLRYQDTVKGTQVALPATIRCDEPGLSVSVSAHSDQRVPGPPTYGSRGACLRWN
ncbi:MAG: hypothetical protein ACK5IA_15045 [Cyanobacteriota bacterium]